MSARRAGWVVLVTVLALSLVGHLCPPSTITASLDHGERAAAASSLGEPVTPSHQGHNDGHRGHHETHLGACEPGARLERPGISSVASDLTVEPARERAHEPVPARIVGTWRVAVRPSPPDPPDPLFLLHSVLLI
jgi:hypothetical protein